MRRSPLLDAARAALRSPDKSAVEGVIGGVNLSPQEKEVIMRHEIGREPLEAICQSFASWGRSERKRGRVCSYSQIVRIKKAGMEKVGAFVSLKNGN